MQIKSAKDLIVYQKAYTLAMDVFQVSKKFPIEEKYSLTDQIRRSSRSVCSNLREAWSKRRYAAHFATKLTDCDGENAETDTWLDFAHDCHYMTTDIYNDLKASCDEVGKMLGAIIKSPDKFILHTDR